MARQNQRPGDAVPAAAAPMVGAAAALDSRPARPSLDVAPSSRLSLCAEAEQAALAAERAGDFQGHALLIEVASRLGQLRARLAEAGPQSDAVTAVVDKVKALL